MDSIREEDLPHLFSFAKNTHITVLEAWNKNNEDLYDLFNLPLSVTAHEEFHTLKDELNSLDITTEHDRWEFAWGDRYSIKKVYNLIGETHQAPQTILDIWKTSNIPRQKFFAWLMLHGRLNTKDMMSKKNFFVEFNDCILCDECPQETIMHLFFECSFSQSFWWAIGIEWNADMNIHEMISDAKARYPIQFIMDIIISGCWSLWDQRNDAIFNGNFPDLRRCIIKFKKYLFYKHS
jgi:hypothetical protein